MFDNLITTQVGTATVVRLDLDDCPPESRPCLMVFFNEGDSIFQAIRVDENTVTSQLNNF